MNEFTTTLDAISDLKRARINYASALLRAYLYWLSDKRRYDKIIEGLFAAQPSETGPVQGGLPSCEQERIVEFKETDPDYTRLASDITRMQRVLGALEDREQEFIRHWFWNKTPWHEICDIFSVTRKSLYYWRDTIAEKVAILWDRDGR